MKVYSPPLIAAAAIILVSHRAARGSISSEVLLISLGITVTIIIVGAFIAHLMNR